MTNQYVILLIHRSLYGIPIQEVSEIIRMQSVNWIPNERKEFLGILRLRDKLIPIVSLHLMLGEVEKEIDMKMRIIILHIGEQEMGIVVDGVEQVMLLSETHISPPPQRSHQSWIHGIYHHQDRIIALLKLEALFADFTDPRLAQNNV